MKKGKKSYQKIFEHSEYVIVSKSAGVLSVPERFTDETSLKRMLRDKYGEIYTVHRLDQYTSGLIIFARNMESHRIWNQMFEERRITKKYLAIVEGRLYETEGEIDHPILRLPNQNRVVIHKQGKESLTSYKVKEQFGSHALLELELHTGRTHQIRIHLKALGFPLMVDPVYGRHEEFMVSSVKGKNKFHLEKGTVERPLLTRTPLHASYLSFEDPFDKEHRVFESPVPKDMRATLHQLRKWDKY
ncbi:RluA family pseudouridine synthase [Membranicola marinus]|uniref:RluA family pseudouridine synthase n=1 Tax=Membranihabitans marinus TaxID=1227546 RepID=A0A953HX92_9BACT|nr:RluA family pseudouridine synthase [Membranihabitans marinus]MBY5960170.1 RluA family pseudouridine synthase [Membranihabitans marinus]